MSGTRRSPLNLNEARQRLVAKITAKPVIDKPALWRPETLYHYTTADGLLGIVSSNLLRASNALYMNDASELQYARTLIQEVIAEKLAAGGALPGLEFLNRCARDNFSILSFLQPHVACFCESGDLLSQWRGYADRGGGYAIGFEALSLARPSDYLLNPTEADLLQVEYDNAVQKSTAEERVESVRNALDECVKEEPTAEGDLIPAACMFFRDYVANLVFSYKHSAFREEREWRMVCLRQRDNIESFKLRPGNGFLVPYTDLDLRMRVGPNTGRLPISHIVIGPSLHPELAAKAVELLLRKYQFRHVEVRGSEVPLRV